MQKPGEELLFDQLLQIKNPSILKVWNLVFGVINTSCSVDPTYHLLESSFTIELIRLRKKLK